MRHFFTEDMQWTSGDVSGGTGGLGWTTSDYWNEQKVTVSSLFPSVSLIMKELIMTDKEVPLMGFHSLTTKHFT